MIIAQYLDILRRDYVEMAIMSAESIKHSNPNACRTLIGTPLVIEHLSKYYNDTIPITGMMDVPYSYRRMIANIAFQESQEDFCFADVDTLFLKNIKPVFEHPFEIAPTLECPLRPEIPRYCWGVCFSRATKFWDEVVTEGFTKRQKQPMDIEYLATAIVRKYHFHELEGSIYNHLVDNLGENFNNHVSILHFRGQRKRFMKPYYERMFASV